MRVLLTGKNGQIGWELARLLPDWGETAATGRQELDLSNPDAIRETLRRMRPELIVNAAAYTDVNRAESEPEQAQALNATAVAVMAEEAKALDAALVHFSTDYVFDGLKSTGPYVEDDPTNPQSVYGSSKRDGEDALRQAGIPHLILRTSWVYGGRGKNFFLLVRKLAEERDTLTMVDDQTGAPSWCRSIAEATLQILNSWYPQGISRPDAQRTGTYHLSCAGQTTWYGFAKAILEGSKLAKPPRVVPIATSEFPTPAVRPPYSVLSNEKLERAFGVRLPSWQEALDLCLKSGVSQKE